MYYFSLCSYYSVMTGKYVNVDSQRHALELEFVRYDIIFEIHNFGDAITEVLHSCQHLLVFCSSRVVARCFDGVLAPPCLPAHVSVYAWGSIVKYEPGISGMSSYSKSGS